MTSLVFERKLFKNILKYLEQIQKVFWVSYTVIWKLLFF